MTLAAIKEKHKKQIEEFSQTGYELEVHIGTKNFELTRGPYEVKLVKLEGEFENHLVVALQKSDYFAPKDLLKENSVGAFNQIYRIMIAYWREYAKLKGLDGVIVVGSHELKSVLYQFGGNESKKEREFLKAYVPLEVQVKNKGNLSKYYSTVPADFCGAFISDELKRKIGIYHNAMEVLEEVEEKESIFSLKRLVNNKVVNMFAKDVTYTFIGEEIEVGLEFNGEFGEPCFTFSVGEEEMAIALRPELVLKVLKELEGQKALVNLVESPRDNFDAFIGYVASHFGMYGYEEEDVYRREFDELCSLYGGWKEVEKEFAELRKVETEEIIRSKDEASKKELKVIKAESSSNTVYVLYYRLNADEGMKKDFFVKVASNEEDKIRIRGFISDLLTKDLF